MNTKMESLLPCVFPAVLLAFIYVVIALLILTSVHILITTVVSCRLSKILTDSITENECAFVTSWQIFLFT